MVVCVGSPATFSTRKCRVGERGDLGQVGDRDHLGTAGEPLQGLPDCMGGLTADPGVDLVEDHRLAAANGRDCEGDA